MNNWPVKTFAIFVLVVALAGETAGQSGVHLFAATATVHGKGEVRLRWQIKEGWIPSRGLRLYRGTGADKQLVRAIPQPTDAQIDGLLPQGFRGRKLATNGLVTVPPGNGINFTSPRPPSSKPEFDRRKNALDDLKNLKGPFLPPNKVNLRAQKIAIARPPSNPPTIQSRPSTVPPTIKVPLAARSELHLASLLDETNAEVIGLGATDSGVQHGQKVAYSLYAVNSSGQDQPQPLAILDSFVVGSDAGPHAPTGLMAAQDENRITLRWDRLSVPAEKQFLTASYQIFRFTPTSPSPQKINRKPVLIMTTSDQKEPLAFFEDRIPKPGTYTYRVALTDGFDRTSEAGTLTVDASDWREPDKPRFARCNRGLDFEMQFKGIAFGLKKVPTVQVQLQATIAWIPGNAPVQMPVQFNISRGDLDNSASLPVKLTASPISGTRVPVATEVQMESALDLILGKDRDQLAQAEVDRIMARQLVPDRFKRVDAAERDRAVDAAKSKSAYKTRVERVRDLLTNVGAFTYVDGTAQKDRKYVYYVTAQYTTNDNETDPISAGELDIPDNAMPSAVSTFSGVFSAAPPRTLVYSKLSSLAPFKPFAGPGILQRKSEKRVTSARAVGPSMLGAMVDPRNAMKLNFLPTDEGGYADLTWSPVPNLIGVQYRISRKLVEVASPPPPRSHESPTKRSVNQLQPAPVLQPADRVDVGIAGASVLQPADWVDVGIVGAGNAKFRDPLPKSRLRNYQYRIIPISRWGVQGSPKLTSVIAPATVPPDKPNLLSAVPGNDREILLNVEAPSSDQSVAQYTVFQDGQPLSTAFANSGVVDRVLTFHVTNLQPGIQRKFKVKAETSGGAQSLVSEEIKGAALKLICQAPTGLSGTLGSEGVTLSWVAASDSHHYVLRRRLASGVQFVGLKSDLTATTYKDTTAIAGQRYAYEVRAVDESGNSAAATVNVPP